jgi:hypothetical protein
MNKIRLRVAVLAAAMAASAMLLGASIASGATITVSNTNDSGPGSLRQAIADATGADTIVVPAGTYNLDSALTVSQALTLVGAGANQTVLDGQGSTEIMAITSPAAGVTITGMTLEDGNASDGGAINAAVPLTLDDDAITGNTAGSGGGIYSSSTLTMDQDLVAGNTAPTGDGGGIDLGPASPTVNTISDTTIALNSSGSAAGGINILNSSTESVKLLNDTLVGNTSGQGGAFRAWSGTTIEFGNSVLAENTASSSAPTCAYGGGATVTSLGHNASDTDDPGCGFGSTDLTNATLQLGPLQNDGGPTATYEPATTSPLINAGSASLCTATDQRGVPRPQGSGCDIGAVERTTPAIGAATVAGTTSTTATLTASATTVYLSGSVVANYGGNTSYGETSAPQSLQGGAATTPAALTLTGLSPATTYHADIVLTTPDGSATTADVTFTTAAAPTTTTTVTTPTVTTPTPTTTVTTPTPTTTTTTPTAAPTLSGVHLTQTHFKVGKTSTAVSAGAAKVAVGTAFAFQLSAAASVTVSINSATPGLRSGKRCVKPTAALKRKHARGCSLIKSVGTLTRTTEGAGRDQLAFSGRIGLRVLSPGRYTATLTASNTGGHSTPATVTFTILRNY